jgi:hypothetical protein
MADDVRQLCVTARTVRISAHHYRLADAVSVNSAPTPA